MHVYSVQAHSSHVTATSLKVRTRSNSYFSCWSTVEAMSIRCFFKPIDGLPDSKGSLSRAIPSAAIVSANREVQKVMDSGKKKRGPYKRYILK